MRLIVSLIAALFLLAGTAQADVETQGWHQDPAHTPSQEHLHQLVTGVSPLDVLAGQKRTVQVTVLLHNSRAHVNWVRWQCESDTQQTVNVNFTGTGAHEETFGPVTLTIDPAKCPGAWREIRIASNSDKGAPGGRTFPTTRLCLSTTGSGTNYCGGPSAQGRCGGGQWYTATAYSVSFVDCRDVKTTQTRALVAGDKIRVKAQTDTSGGKLFAHIDPKFHDFNPGTVVLNGVASGSWQTVTIPAGLAAGSHKLVVRSHEANGEEGVFVLPFTVGAARTTTAPMPAGTQPAQVAGSQAEADQMGRAAGASAPSGCDQIYLAKCVLLTFIRPAAPATYFNCAATDGLCWTHYNIYYESAPGHDFGGVYVGGDPAAEPSINQWVRLTSCGDIGDRQSGIAYYWWVSAFHDHNVDPGWTDSQSSQLQGPPFLIYC